MAFSSRACPLCLLIALCAAMAAPTQGGISGVVVGPGGAPAAKAQITLVRKLSGDLREIVADASGKYSASGLLPGDYTLTAISPASGAKAVLNVTVRAGAATEVRIELDVSPMAGSVQPLDGRNYLDLVRLNSEILGGQQGGNIEGFGPYGIFGNTAINSYGQRGQENNFLLDGIDNNSPWVRGLVVPPSVEAAAGVTVFTGYVPPEYGRASGAVISVDTHRGSSQLHGYGYEYAQSSAVNARNFFDGAIPTARRNQFGGALGGPVLGGGRWSFFVDGEAIRERTGQTVTSTVPTVGEKGGAFPNTSVIYDPTTIRAVATDIYQRNPFPANKIPSASQPQAVRSLLALYPNPTSASSVNNYSNPASGILNRTAFDFRTDYAISGNSSVFARFSAGSTSGQSPGALPAPSGIGFPAGGYGGSDPLQNAYGVNSSANWRAGALRHIVTLSPGLVNELRVGFTTSNLDAVAADAGFNASSAFHISGLSAYGMPEFSVPGYASLGAAGAAPFTIGETSSQVDDMLAGKSGKHSWKAGVQFIQHNVNGDASEWSSRSEYFFSPDYTSQPGLYRTGDSFASFMLGYPLEVRRDVQFQPFHLRASEAAGFLQDSYRIGKRLTVEAGARYSLFPPLTEANNRMVNFNFSNSAPALNQFAGQGGVSAYDGVGYRKTAVAPRASLAYDVTGRGSLMVRAGFTQMYDAGSYLATGNLASNAPYASRLDMVNGTFQLGPNISTGLPASAALTLGSAAALNASQQSINAVQIANYTPYSDQWSLGLEAHPFGLKVEAIGMGSMGMHLLAIQDVNQPYPAPTPYSHPRYPYEPYRSRIEYIGFAGGSTYYGGTFRISGHWRSIARLQASYTMAKSLDDATAPGSDQASRPTLPQYTYDLRGSRSPSPFDVAQRVVATARFDSPVRSPASGAMNLAADWSLFVTAALQTGLPFTPELAVNSLNNGGIQLPNRVASGTLPASQRSYLDWFETSLTPSDPNRAFQLPALYQYGNSGFDILRGPGLTDVDAALSRLIKGAGFGRFEVRAEAFNLLNHVNYALPNRILGLPDSGVIDHTATPSRKLQLGLRLEW